MRSRVSLVVLPPQNVSSRNTPAIATPSEIEARGVRRRRAIQNAASSDTNG
jgi:hypothetical protein